MGQCQQYVFYILFSFTVYMWGPFSPLRNTPPGVPGRTPVSNRGRGHLAAICDLGAARAGCVRGACSGQRGARVACLAVARERFFCGTKKWFLLFSTRITLCYLRTCVCSWLAKFRRPRTPTGSLWHLGAKLAERWHIRELGLCVLLGARGVRAHLLLYAVALRLEPEVAVGDLVRDRV